MPENARLNPRVIYPKQIPTRVAYKYGIKLAIARSMPTPPMEKDPPKEK